MSLVKGNLARKRTGMKYQIIDATVVIDGKNEILPRTDWLGESEESADEVLQKNRDADGSGNKDKKKIEVAKALVMAQLETGPKLLRDVYRVGEEQGISDKTIQRANRELGIFVRKQPEETVVAVSQRSTAMAQRGTCNDGSGRRAMKVVDKKLVDKPYTVLLVHLLRISCPIYIKKGLTRSCPLDKVVDRQHTVSTLSTTF